MTIYRLYDSRAVLAGAFQWARMTPLTDTTASIEVELTGPNSPNDVGHSTYGPFSTAEAKRRTADMNRVAEKHAHATGVLQVHDDETGECVSWRAVETMGGRPVKIEEFETRDDAMRTAVAWARSYGARYVGNLQWGE